MKGVYFNGKKDILVKTDLPKPNIKDDEVLVKVKYCGICGSDIESYKTGVLETPGIIIGHEFSGEIIELGENVRGWKIGDQVTVNPSLPCEECYWCLHSKENMCKWLSALGTTYDGAMAEFINVKSQRLFKIPDSISYKEAALLEPFCVALYAVEDSHFKIGDSVAVLGAGSIGLFTIQVLKLAGASEIFVIEPVESKRKLALEMGADNAFLPKKSSKINRLTKKIGPDHIFDCVGNPNTIMNAMQLVKRGGFITIIGIYPEAFEMKGFMSLVLKSVSMKGVFGYTQDIWQKAIKLLEKKNLNLKNLITNTISIEEVPEYFEFLANSEHEDIKVLVEF
ncbi:MAG: alcohol dehydrogenase catalytic domain-containing protein [Candidatus Lokiarchaeota archaeon]|nr:alcohol dehydrogenase catalytic domain-containing protein [Candidatus Lokiarchaeota archaeon]MBD3198899.1 alcohol dehydrogenase catalytic domain-containing protein [Candidatus Lokiarchaeota archaeon]